jgi:hypothetical protein
MKRSVANRVAQFDAASPTLQLDLKNDIEYSARAQDETQPEYWRERAQKTYEDEYFTTRLFLSVVSRSGAVKPRCALVLRNAYEREVLQVRSRILRRPHVCFMVLGMNDFGADEAMLDISTLRLGATRREPIEGKVLPMVPFREALDSCGARTTWPHTQFVIWKALPKVGQASSDPSSLAKSKEETIAERYSSTVRPWSASFPSPRPDCS